MIRFSYSNEGKQQQRAYYGYSKVLSHALLEVVSSTIMHAVSIPPVVLTPSQSDLYGTNSIAITSMIYTLYYINKLRKA